MSTFSSFKARIHRKSLIFLCFHWVFFKVVRAVYAAFEFG